MTSAKELLEKLHKQEIAPEELVEKAILRAKESQKQFHSFIYFDENHVRNELKEGSGPLYGMPLVISDVIKWKGTLTTFGSILLKDKISLENSPEASRLKAAGLILIGKGNVGEFGLGYETENDLAPPTLNALDSSLTLGGSGGGVANAVIENIAPWGVGTDVSGAMRIGASCTGLYALLPTRGRVPLLRRHLLPYTERMFYRKGTIAKNPYDLALLFNYLTGVEPSDPLSLHQDIPDFVECQKNKSPKLKIGFSVDLGFIPVEDQVKIQFEETISKLEAMGHVVEIAPFKFSPDMIEHFKDLFSTDRYLLISQFLDEAGEKQKDLTEDTFKWLQLGNTVSGYRYALALVYQGWVDETYRRLFQRYDVLLTPSLPVETWKRGHAPKLVNGKPLDPFVGLSSFLFPLNMSGNPALVFPAGVSASGAPIGMQLIADQFKEEKLFQLANDLHHYK